MGIADGRLLEPTGAPFLDCGQVRSGRRHFRLLACLGELQAKASES